MMPKALHRKSMVTIIRWLSRDPVLLNETIILDYISPSRRKTKGGNKVIRSKMAKLPVSGMS